jgi:hypothetical protein
MSCYVYIESEPGLYTVGFFPPDAVYTDGRYVAKWLPESDHLSRESAAARVNFLNGGRGLEDGGGPLTLSGVRRKHP